MSNYRPLLVAWLALLLLLALSVAALQWAPATLAHVVSLACAVSMAALILAFFMGLRHSAGLVRVFALGGVLWLGLMSVLTAIDYVTR